MRDILIKLKNGEIDIDEAEKRLKLSYFEELGEFCKLDVNRKHRTGIPEAIYGESKNIKDLAEIMVCLAEKNNVAFATRVRDIDALKKELEKYDLENFNLRINETARTFALIKKGHKIEKIGKIGILAAGTSDIPVAEEAKETAEIMGCEVIKSYDVGIAGVHRLFKPLKKMIEEDVCCIIVVAGMEGALPSLVTSLVDVPVIGVPTSVGYGVKITPILTMLHSCSPGLAIVNIDNGFGAGAFAGLIASMIYQKH
ncbi:nickel pincer cofactor biosynthesis protein LarB [Methanotorris igneus]|uniref:1-(5-phosphoribosyl)-5-amino-4-imidazole-carboxylate (AIR) carboxylase n=1 Tax=Methanotorris igneus (strain DSM 5666 / JCM 11834 / Kol 5) TaxID=880724 RepID=F6BB87_METIK|nr:nickel pincer cofactor biosynthesis protein LarB [Methanotorris igneus]AEF95972.1 1-(5-phosphoribosyl)-5-amino-4-imidazole-carboxylate (AIR) carboxylase [Methanotorris igneus Kol 5]